MKTLRLQRPTSAYALLRRAARALFHTLFGASADQQLWARMAAHPAGARPPAAPSSPRTTCPNQRWRTPPAETPGLRTRRRRRSRRAAPSARTARRF
jgi:hypothetical protein